MSTTTPPPPKPTTSRATGVLNLAVASLFKDGHSFEEIKQGMLDAFANLTWQQQRKPQARKMLQSTINELRNEHSDSEVHDLLQEAVEELALLVASNHPRVDLVSAHNPSRRVKGIPADIAAEAVAKAKAIGIEITVTPHGRN